MINHDSMTLDELQDHLTNVINARESYPDDSLNKKAIALDEDYLNTTNAITTLTTLMDKVKAWIREDTHRKEIFTDIEICSEEDNIDADVTIDEIIDNSYTIHTCMAFMDATTRDFILCYAGWMKTSGQPYFTN